MPREESQSHSELREPIRRAIVSSWRIRAEQDEALSALDSLIEQLEAAQKALREIADTEWYGVGWEDRLVGPEDIALAALNPATRQEIESRNLDGTNHWTPHDDPRGIGR